LKGPSLHFTFNSFSKCVLEGSFKCFVQIIVFITCTKLKTIWACMCNLVFAWKTYHVHKHSSNVLQQHGTHFLLMLE
jgi:hypothetical protein